MDSPTPIPPTRRLVHRICIDCYEYSARLDRTLAHCGNPCAALRICFQMLAAKVEAESEEPRISQVNQ